jgi:maltose/moltooligosaccharide transporter
LHVENIAAKGVIADNVKYSFYIGAFFFLSAVLFTVFSTRNIRRLMLALRKR